MERSVLSNAWSGRMIWLGTLVLGVSLSARAAASEDPKAAVVLADPQAAPTPKPEEAVSEGWHLDGLGFKKGKNEIKLAGYVQEDLRSYQDWEVHGDETGVLRAPTDEMRRLRVGVEGNFGDLTFEFVVDPRSNQAPDRLKDAALGYKFSKSLNLLVGHFKPPVSQEYLTSAGKIDFVDR